MESLNNTTVEILATETNMKDDVATRTKFASQLDHLAANVVKHLWEAEDGTQELMSHGAHGGRLCKALIGDGSFTTKDGKKMFYTNKTYRGSQPYKQSNKNYSAELREMKALLAASKEREAELQAQLSNPAPVSAADEAIINEIDATVSEAAATKKDTTKKSNKKSK